MRNGLLYLEPSAAVSAEPVDDELTRGMEAAFAGAEPGPAWRGFHVCACGARSSNRDYKLPGSGELWTNSLCVHYLRRHRAEVPAPELERVRAYLEDGVAQPGSGVYHSPERLRQVLELARDGRTVRDGPGSTSVGLFQQMPREAVRALSSGAVR